jgi:hypothetical protein
MCAHHVEDEGGDLRRRVGQAVESLIDLVGEDRELHSHGDVDENVVARLGLDLDRELLDAQVHVGDDLVDQRDLEVESRARNVQKLTQALDDSDFLLLDREP